MEAFPQRWRSIYLGIFPVDSNYCFWDVRFFNSLEMGASQPGQQHEGSSPWTGKWLPVMTFFHLCISHSVTAFHLSPKPGYISHLMLPNSSGEEGWEAGRRKHKGVECLLAGIHDGRQKGELWTPIFAGELKSKLTSVTSVVKVSKPAGI